MPAFIFAAIRIMSSSKPGSLTFFRAWSSSCNKTERLERQKLLHGLPWKVAETEGSIKITKEAQLTFDKLTTLPDLTQGTTSKVPVTSGCSKAISFPGSINSFPKKASCKRRQKKSSVKPSSHRRHEYLSEKVKNWKQNSLANTKGRTRQAYF